MRKRPGATEVEVAAVVRWAAKVGPAGVCVPRATGKGVWSACLHLAEQPGT